MEENRQESIYGGHLVHRSFFPLIFYYLILSLLGLAAIAGISFLLIFIDNTIPASQLLLFELIIIAFTHFFISVFFLSFLLKWFNNYYFIKETSIIIKTGLLSVQEREIKIAMVIQVTVNQSFIGKLFNYGTITIKTARQDITLSDIPKPFEYARMIEEKAPQIPTDGNSMEEY